MSSQLYDFFDEEHRRVNKGNAQKMLGALVQEDQYIGDVFSMGYESALVLIHDHHREKVGGIPSLSFLIATRINLGSELDYTAEESSVLLLRVMDAAPLPNAAEAERVRVETAQRVSGETGVHWDDTKSMDATTSQLLSFAGVKCRVIGTFFLDTDTTREGAESLVLRFGSDISNYYPNRGLKVYKPNREALARIVNYRDPDRIHQDGDQPVVVGQIRYASTNRAFQGVSDVEVSITPADLLGQKTALFGMTRTGKSNTTKIILQSVFNLRFDKDKPLRIGQIVFDPDGEYANENEQDPDSKKNPSAIKNVWAATREGKREDVVTYGIRLHPEDPERKLMLLNFYEEGNLQIGKSMIDGSLATDPSKFLQNFQQVTFEKPEETDRSSMTRYQRRVLAYRALLAKAGFDIPGGFSPSTKSVFGQSLFNKALLEAMRNSSSEKNAAYASAAEVFSKEKPSWAALATAFEHLHEFIKDAKSGYKIFEQDYVKTSSSGEAWADRDLEMILETISRSNGAKQVAKMRVQHTADTKFDFAEEIYKELLNGKFVIVDQSSGDYEVNKSSAARIMDYIFRQNQEKFRQGVSPLPEILVYVEEAHNLLPAAKETDYQDVWVKTAKEGGKYHIGLVYATQEVSSIQRNILKNTANWFIGHLNNTDETKELCKYYDFADFEASIRRAQDKGFLRVKTLSNLFVIPAQIKKFEV